MIYNNIIIHNLLFKLKGYIINKKTYTLINYRDSKRFRTKNHYPDINIIQNHNSHKWQRLMLETFAGNRQSYHSLLREFEIWLNQYFASLSDEFDRDLLTMDILKAVHNKLSSYDQSRPVLPWLMAIADYRLSISPLRLSSD